MRGRGMFGDAATVKVRAPQKPIGAALSSRDTVIRESAIAGEEPENQQYPDQRSLLGAYEGKGHLTT